LPFCKSGQKLKSGYILSRAGLLKRVGFQPEPKYGTALLLFEAASASHWFNNMT
jgi:hypothetical protein